MTKSARVYECKLFFCKMQMPQKWPFAFDGLGFGGFSVNCQTPPLIYIYICITMYLFYLSMCYCFFWAWPFIVAAISTLKTVMFPYFPILPIVYLGLPVHSCTRDRHLRDARFGLLPLAITWAEWTPRDRANCVFSELNSSISDIPSNPVESS